MESFNHTYKGYCAVFDWDKDHYHGIVTSFDGSDFSDVVTAEAKTVEEAKIEMEKSIDDYLDFVSGK